jgi:hypothetical protein
MISDMPIDRLQVGSLIVYNILSPLQFAAFTVKATARHGTAGFRRRFQISGEFRDAVFVPQLPPTCTCDLQQLSAIEGLFGDLNNQIKMDQVKKQ